MIDRGHTMNRKNLLAAETFSYSYPRYAERLEEGHVRFTTTMPDDIDILEKAEREGWDDTRLARAIDIPLENVASWRKSYREALDIIDAPTPAEAFRRGVRHSIQYALQEGLASDDDVEKLVVQVCYRAADLAYLLDMTGERLAAFSRELRKEPGVTYLD
jgi:hypothetical protein